MAEIVKEVLARASEAVETFKPVTISKDIDVGFDLGNLLVCDPNPIDTKLLRTEQEVYIKNLARDNTQLIINKIWELPTERFEGALVVKLPPPTTIVPREKPLPKAKPPTRWEQYAKKKGIQKRKKEKLVWDETTQDWKPRWGFRRVNDDKNDWLIEIPENSDPNVDYFGKKKEEKKERIAKNEFQRLRNIARAQKTKVPGVGITPSETPSKQQVKTALAVAKTSVASVGKFTSKLPNEKPPQNLGKKRKAVKTLSNEERQLGDYKQTSKKKTESKRRCKSGGKKGRAIRKPFTGKGKKKGEKG
ncbi:ribosome biogenesis regulatory protein homolog isoform X2 [Tachypleus tridentatus]|uniref:ribosome biogenesis regulatory protein homolog isoform X2 n=1 Tax=Tachypleus tridentatus TaxID=6853 RepID=UPI003FD54C68